MANKLYDISNDLRISLSIPSKIVRGDEIVRALMEYVEEHNLIDPKNKMIYRSDGVLRYLMNWKQYTSAFSALRDLKHHLREVDQEEESQGEGQLASADAEEEDDLDWYRELTVQQPTGEFLTLKCNRKNGESVLSINGFEIYESEFEDYYSRVVGNNPTTIQSDFLLGLALVMIALVASSLWIALVNQGLKKNC
jgi:hypothetical protein